MSTKRYFHCKKIAIYFVLSSLSCTFAGNYEDKDEKMYLCKAVAIGIPADAAVLVVAFS